MNRGRLAIEKVTKSRGDSDCESKLAGHKIGEIKHSIEGCPLKWRGFVYGTPRQN